MNLIENISTSSPKPREERKLNQTTTETMAVDLSIAALLQAADYLERRWISIHHYHQHQLNHYHHQSPLLLAFNHPDYH